MVLGKYHSAMKCFFVELNGNVYCRWIVNDSSQVNAENCKLYNAVSRRLRRFARYLISLCQPYVLQMQRNELSTAFIMHLHIFLKYMFQFFINKALSASNSVHYPGCERLFYSYRPREKPLVPRVSVHRQNFMMWKVLTLQSLFNISCRGAIDNAVTLHVNCLGFDSSHRKLFFCFCFLSFVFLKHIFIFWHT